MMYDYLVVGAGLYGSVFAHEAKMRGKKCLVIDKRDHVAGNIYTRNEGGIDVHVYGAHIFHTDDEEVWNYANSLCTFNRFTNAPIARFGDKVYNLPFNMNTFRAMWGVTTPEEARSIIRAQVEKENIGEPKNLEEQALKLVGRDIYEALVKGYTQKQWGRPCSELPAFIIRRLPVRFTYDNNYFNDRFQGIPEEGYTAMVERLLEGIDVRLGVDFLKNREELSAMAEKIVYTGPIDEYFDYCLGTLEYRSLRFESERVNTENYQGCAVVNYTDAQTPYTRIIEHKHFAKNSAKDTVITREYPAAWQKGDEPYYPVNNDENAALYARYAALAEEQKNVIFGGRLGLYKYFDMDDVIRRALDDARSEMD